MDAIGPETAGNHAAPSTEHWWRRWGRLLLFLFVAVVASAGGGFLWFVDRIETTETAPARDADGIVALTGGPFRINDALELLAAGRGQRLLITGVNPVTRPTLNPRTGSPRESPRSPSLADISIRTI